ncbi:MAG: signal peptidase I [Oscillospiraceae bacterium]|nr:signal peptidase I [Oscillospiraceae bacterium]
MEEAKLPEEKTSIMTEIYEWVQSIITALVAGIIMFTFIARPVAVDGTSMLQTLQDKDLVVAWSIGYTPKNGDIIVFETESYTRGPLVKRVIATGGQTVDIDFSAGIVYVDGEALEEDYTNTLTTRREDFTGPVTVPEGYMFCMGDNRNGSKDSRSSDIGLVDIRCTVGKVFFILMPGPSDGDNQRHWNRIGIVK